MDDNQMQERLAEFKQVFNLSDQDVSTLMLARNHLKRTAFGAKTMAQAQLLELGRDGDAVAELLRVCKRWHQARKLETRQKRALIATPMRSYATKDQIEDSCALNDDYRLMAYWDDVRDAWLEYLDRLLWRLKERNDNLQLIYPDQSGA